MSANLPPEPKSSSRRALLAGAVGGLGALAASAIGRAGRVRAVDGDPVLVGGLHAGTAGPQITASSGPGFVGITTNSSSGIGLLGKAFVASGLTTGVYGENSSVSGTGVRGVSVQDTGSTYGVAGVVASPSGVGVQATNAAGGLALQTAGRVKFSTSGIASMSAGRTSHTVSPGVELMSNSSFVLLTPRSNLGGRDLWVTVNATANTFTVHISSSREYLTRVGWLLVG